MFVKVHMPWEVLCTYAEVLHIKLPIQPNDLSSRPSPWRYFSFITKYFYPNEDLIRKETEFFTAPFEKDRLDYFYVKDKDIFFTPSMRSRMVGFFSCLKFFLGNGNKIKKVRTQKFKGKLPSPGVLHPESSPL